jgi:putative membrane protein
MEHMIGYDLARGLHIIAVIAWVAGLLMLPRFYAYISASQPGGELEQAMLKAARNLRVIILSPAIVLSWALGLFLFFAYVSGISIDWDWARLAAVPHWFWLKLLLVVGLSGYQGFLSSEGRRLAAGERRHSEKFWRRMSEVPFLVAIVVVLLVTAVPDTWEFGSIDAPA